MLRLSFHAIVRTLWALYLGLGLRSRSMATRPGQGLVEYALILVLIAVTCIGILTLTGRNLSTAWYNRIIAAFP